MTQNQLDILPSDQGYLDLIYGLYVKRGTLFDTGLPEGSEYIVEKNSITNLNRALFNEEMVPNKQMDRVEFGGLSTEDRILYLELQAAGVLDLERQRKGKAWNNELEEETGRAAMGVITSSIEAVTSWLKSLMLTDNLESLIQIRPSNFINLGDESLARLKSEWADVMEEESRNIFDAEHLRITEQLTGLKLQPEEGEVADMVVAEDENREQSIFPDDKREKEIAERLLRAAYAEEKEVALEKAQQLTDIARDALTLTKSFKEEMKFLTQAFTFPTAIIGHRFDEVPVRTWVQKGEIKELVTEKKVLPAEWAVHPENVYITDDGDTFEDATSFVIVHNMRYYDINNLKNIDNKAVRKENIENILEHPLQEIQQRNGVVDIEKQMKEQIRNNVDFNNLHEKNWSERPSQSIDVFEQWTVVTREQLEAAEDWQLYFDKKPANLSEVQYRLVTFYADGLPIWVELLDMCDDSVRYKSYSFKKVHDSFWGTGFAEILRPIDISMRKLSELLIKHLNKVLDPAQIVDSVAMDMNKIGPDGLHAGKTYKKNSAKQRNNGASAAEYFEIKNNIASILTAYEFLDGLVQKLTGISPLAVGLLTGIGSNIRSSSQQRELTEQSLKTLTTRVFEAYCEIAELRRAHMLPFFMNDPEYAGLVQGDAEVKVFGIQNKIFKNQRVEVLREGLQYALGSDLIEKRDAKALLDEFFRELGVETKNLQSARDILKEASNDIKSESSVNEQDQLAQLQQLIGSTPGVAELLGQANATAQ